MEQLAEQHIVKEFGKVQQIQTRKWYVYMVLIVKGIPFRAIQEVLPEEIIPFTALHQIIQEIMVQSMVILTVKEYGEVQQIQTRT